jgi:cytochrome P450
MQSANDLDLPFLPIDSEGMGADPAPYFVEARKKHPWLGRCKVGFIVTEFQAIKDIRSMDDHLCFPAAKHVEYMGAQGTGWAKFTQELMIARSGDDHARLRASVAYAFTPRAVNRLRESMRTEVANLINTWTPKGTFDFAEFAAYFPISVMFGLIGADPSALGSIKWALDVQGGSYGLDRSRMPIIEEAYQVLWKFVDALVIERGPNGGKGDFLDDLIAANTSGDLSDDELRIMLVFLFGAGYDTSKNLLTLIMHAMLDRPEMWARCAADLSYCEKVVEEALRYTSPVNPMKTVTKTIEYRDVAIESGATVIFPLSISGRDEGSFPNADVFDPDRAHDTRNIAFGRGAHICLGQFLARAQTEEGLHVLAQRITRPKLAGEVTWRSFPSTWGIQSLPVTVNA